MQPGPGLYSLSIQTFHKGLFVIVYVLFDLRGGGRHGVTDCRYSMHVLLLSKSVMMVHVQCTALDGISLEWLRLSAYVHYTLHGFESANV